MKKFLFFSLLCFNFLVHAQLKVTAELRPRFEYRHGFKQPFPEAVEAANFISQRTRFKLDFKSKDLDFYTSFQNIRVWGDVPQLNTADKNGIALHQAWVNWKISPNNSLKIGRQELVYDNSRMFGNVGWAQQARSHDTLIFRFHKNNNKLHLGLAYNQDGEAVVGNILSGNTYKALQYAWFQKTNDTHVWSLLFLNNGLQSDPNLNSKIKYSQTLGGTFSYNKKPLNILSEAYYQGGKDKTDNTLKAYLLSTEINYKSASNFIPGIGFELLSGNDLSKTTPNSNRAFTPFYGTNHKFNGFMDYFYVGNHANSAGLLDLYFKINFKSGSKANYLFKIHHFAAAAPLAGTTDKKLGNEIDFVYSRSIAQHIAFAFGWSSFWDSQNLKTLRNISSTQKNNWAWVMLTFKPKLYTSQISNIN